MSDYGSAMDDAMLSSLVPDDWSDHSSDLDEATVNNLLPSSKESDYGSDLDEATYCRWFGNTVTPR